MMKCGQNMNQGANNLKKKKRQHTFTDCFRKERQNIEKFTQRKSCINYYNSHNTFPMKGKCGENIKCRCIPNSHPSFLG